MPCCNNDKIVESIKPLVKLKEATKTGSWAEGKRSNRRRTFNLSFITTDFVKKVKNFQNVNSVAVDLSSGRENLNQLIY